MKEIPFKKSSEKKWNHLQNWNTNPFKKKSNEKKVHQKIDIDLKFKWKLLYRSDLEEKIIWEFP